MGAIDPLPEWARTPAGGWRAADLDRLEDLPPHTELLDGRLYFRSPSTVFQELTRSQLDHGLRALAPQGWEVSSTSEEIRHGAARLTPDLTVTRRGGLNPSRVLLAIEVMPSTWPAEVRRATPADYAAAGVPHLWWVEREGTRAVVRCYELDSATGRYGAEAVQYDEVRTTRPFPAAIDLTLTSSPNNGH
ncbi:Uma2 family endonuclease [Kitasatospora acidiphila]|uniref:Uma2 family endonuclease n=1 Tax=Kitasatospora acidiphila TaxID=2567942 RepID=A0A540W2Z7_9ACTN|nr:Uma2 family endonuclease [Kitasatospora acidiphila]TQF03352.1 Uma2 family endonuclease [Kitasatospora acidiphila]